ncbi:FAD/NAD(P)-binding protein [Jeotgalicoccus huakuii]|nr:FAD/NAD(P)-binding protein [Jeotgalicoccus huakuii]
MAKKRIAIIGTGVAGTSLVKFFVSDERFNENYVIDLYDGKKTMGRGYAYQHDDENLIVNLPAELMSLTSDQGDYIKWLENNKYEAESYTSRSLYGEYIHSTLMNFVHRHQNINTVESLVEDISFESDENIYTVYADGAASKYDAIFLTNGEMSYSDPYELKGEKNFIYNPYPIEDVLNNVKGRIGIIGSGLSAIDCFRYLLKNGHSKVTVLSRSGELPSVRGTYYELSGEYFTIENAMSDKKHGLIPLDRIIELFRKELRAHGIQEELLTRKTDRPEIDLKFDLEHPDEVGKIQYLISSLEDTFKVLYKYLSRKDKTRFMEEYHELIQSNHSPMPPHGAKQILEWIDKGRLEFLDDMESVEVNDEFLVGFEDKKQEPFDVLINATGPVSDIRKDNTLLIKNLYNRMLVEPDEFGGLLIDKYHRVISPRYGTMYNFYTIGALTVGSDYLIKGVTMLATETYHLVNHFLTHN